MSKYLFTPTVVLSISVMFISLHYAAISAHSSSTPDYALKTWQIADGDSKEYLWSIEGDPNQGPTGTLYRSLASPALRARISRFPTGTKLTWNFVGAGLPNSLPAEDFESFRKFCVSKGIRFGSQIDLF
jgi:hypothetical protein